MNSVLNSDLEQCTESKLSRVHSAPTLGPACTHTAPCPKPGPVVSQAWPSRVAAQTWSCRTALPVVSHRTLGRVAHCTVRHVAAPPVHAAAHCVVASLVVSRAQPAVLWSCPRSYRSLSRDTTQRPSRPLVTSFTKL